MTTFYAIRVENTYGDSFARRGREGNYGGMGPVPDLHAQRSSCQAVIRHYKWLSQNSGKKPSPMKIIKVEI